MTPPFRFGVAYDFRNPVGSGRTDAELYAQIIDQIEMLDGLGYDQIWLTEHHFVDDGYLPSFVPVAGAIASRTKRVRMSTDVALLPFYHPLKLAEDMAVLDILSNGRMELGCGMGYIPKEFAAWGFPRSRRVSLTEECIQVLQLAWQDGPFSFHGKRYDFEDVEVFPKPVQEGGPPLWMGTMSEAGAHRAARLDLHLLPQGDEKVVIEPWKADLEASGRSPSDYRIGMIRSVLVTDDPERDWPPVREAERYKARRYTEWVRGSGDDVTMFDPDAENIPQQWIVGDEAHVATELQAFIDRYGLTDVTSWACPPGLSPEVMNESLERFAKGVRPNLHSPA